MKQYKNKILIGLLVVLLLAGAFFYGGGAPSSDSSADEPLSPTLSVLDNATDKSEQTADQSDEQVSSSQVPDVLPQKEENSDVFATEKEPAAEAKPTVEENKKEFTCTLSVRCDTILKNIQSLDLQKRDLVPQNGAIFAAQTVSFEPGESVLDLLVREMRQHHIHLEYENTPLYGSAYIEGIGNLYEFDCGELSGWMYRVNGQFPNYGCSRYLLQDGDVVEWIYTCDLGADIGGGDFAEKDR